MESRQSLKDKLLSFIDAYSSKNKVKEADRNAGLLEKSKVKIDNVLSNSGRTAATSYHKIIRNLNDADEREFLQEVYNLLVKSNNPDLFNSMMNVILGHYDIQQPAVNSRIDDINRRARQKLGHDPRLGDEPIEDVRRKAVLELVRDEIEKLPENSNAGIPLTLIMPSNFAQLVGEPLKSYESKSPPNPSKNEKCPMEARSENARDQSQSLLVKFLTVIDSYLNEDNKEEIITDEDSVRTKLGKNIGNKISAEGRERAKVCYKMIKKFGDPTDELEEKEFLKKMKSLLEDKAIFGTSVVLRTKLMKALVEHCGFTLQAIEGETLSIYFAHTVKTGIRPVISNDLIAQAILALVDKYINNIPYSSKQHTDPLKKHPRVSVVHAINQYINSQGTSSATPSNFFSKKLQARNIRSGNKKKQKAEQYLTQIKEYFTNEILFMRNIINDLEGKTVPEELRQPILDALCKHYKFTKTDIENRTEADQKELIKSVNISPYGGYIPRADSWRAAINLLCEKVVKLEQEWYQRVSEEEAARVRTEHKTVSYPVNEVEEEEVKSEEQSEVPLRRFN